MSELSARKLIVVGTIMELCYLSFFLVEGDAPRVLLFVAVNAVTFVAFGYTVYLLRRRGELERSDRHVFPIVIGFAILFRLTLVTQQVVASDDIYRYIWDGRVAEAGVNPFKYAPTDPALAHLQTKQLPALINFPDMRTIYPPLAQWLFLSSHVLFGDSVSGLKVLLVLADLMTIIFLVYLLKHRHNSREAVLLYAWSPLPIMYVALDGHIDALGVPFLLLFVLLFLRNRHIAAALSLGASVLAKLYPLFVAPLLLRLVRGPKRLILPLIPVAMLVVSAALYWEPTGGLVESLTEFNSTFEFNGSIFSILWLFLGSNTLAHLVCAVLFLVWLGGVFFLHRGIVERVFLCFLGFAIFSPVVQPWYLLWLSALLVVRWSGAVFALLFFSNLSNLVVYEYRLSGVWRDRPILLVLEYVPFFILLGWEMARGGFATQTEAPAERMA